MKIQQQNGIVSTINFAPFMETEEYESLRKSLFAEASLTSRISPVSRIDIFDESILIFTNTKQALEFLYHLFRAVVNIERNNNFGISLRSSICFGNYFVHQDQIYGDAVNLATKLSYCSRANEMLVYGIDHSIIREFAGLHNDIVYNTREDDSNCVSISLLDQDQTRTNQDTRNYKFEFNGITKEFDLERSRKIQIGRSEDAEIFIDNDRISRNHATITLNFDCLHLEDHSSNGTYIYLDDRELFLRNDSMKLQGISGHISCGLSLYTDSETSNSISFMLSE